MKRLFDITINTTYPKWLLILLVAVFLLRIPSFFEPNWYGDEAIYLSVGQGISNGLMLYRDVYDNKPPMIYILAGIAGNIFWFKAILAFWSLTAVLLFWNLLKTLLPNSEKLTIYSTIIFALLTTLPLLEGNIANAENFLILPTILSFLILLQKDRPSFQRIFLSGLVLGTGVLFKVPAFIDAFVPIVLWFAAFSKFQDSFLGFVKKSAVFLIGVASPFTLTIIFFYLSGFGSQYIAITISQMIGYLSSWGQTARVSAGDNGPLMLRAALTMIFLLGLVALYAREKISKKFLFVGAWFFLSLFAMLLSERPYPHYILQVVPSLSILLGLAIAARGKEQFYAYPLFLVFAVSIVFFKFNYYPVFAYYKNFFVFVTRNQTQDQFFANFDSRTPKNYEISKFLAESAHPQDRLFIWGNDPEIYATSRVLSATPYVVAYHIKELNKYDQVANSLSSAPPRFIITTNNIDDFPQLISILSQNYIKVNYVKNGKQINGTRVYLHIDSNNVLR